MVANGCFDTGASLTVMAMSLAKTAIADTTLELVPLSRPIPVSTADGSGTVALAATHTLRAQFLLSFPRGVKRIVTTAYIVDGLTTDVILFGRNTLNKHCGIDIGDLVFDSLEATVPDDDILDSLITDATIRYAAVATAQREENQFDNSAPVFRFHDPTLKKIMK